MGYFFGGMNYYYEKKHCDNFKRSLSKDELCRFFDSIRATSRDIEQDTLFFTLQLCLAGRINEILGIRLPDFDMERGWVWIVRKKQQRSHAHRACMPLSDEVLVMVRNYVLCRREKIILAGGYLFYSSHRGGLHRLSDNTMQRRFGIARKHAGFDLAGGTTRSGDGSFLPFIRPHTLRATSINMMLRETGGDIIAVMGHSHHDSLGGIMPYLQAYKSEELAMIQKKTFCGMKKLVSPTEK